MSHHQLHAARTGTGEFLSGKFSGSSGSRPFKLYLPPTYTPARPVPLLVALHGCMQDPDDFATGTRFNLLADEHTFLVLYPQQTNLHRSGRCWSWYDALSQQRGSGEPAILAGMIDEVRAQYAIDSERIYLAGLSAGGAMAAIMGACYPDYFAAIGIHSGLEYKAARGLSGARTALLRGGPDPVLQGKFAHLAADSAARVLPVIVFHGTRDYRVYPINGEQVIRQFASMNAYAHVTYAGDDPPDEIISPAASSVHTVHAPGGHSYTVSTYTLDGQVVMQKYLVEGLGHAWSGGSKAPPATYTDPRGPDASTILWDFFVAHPKTSPRAAVPQPAAVAVSPSPTEQPTPLPHIHNPGDLLKATPMFLRNLFHLRKKPHTP